ncbi:MAG: hypothetical protein JWN66_4344 [Sphingomonas bacterium]|nr:hypothetical protein [Sphingomonas bacterium]
MLGVSQAGYRVGHPIGPDTETCPLQIENEYNKKDKPYMRNLDDWKAGGQQGDGFRSFK